jgi:hypothetical protein
VFAAAGTATGAGRLLAERVSASLTAGTAMLAFALVLVVVVIVRPGRAAGGARGHVGEAGRA